MLGFPLSFHIEEFNLPQSIPHSSPKFIFQLATGAVLISFSPVFVAASDVHPTAMAFYRVLIGGLAMGLISFTKFRPNALTRKQWGLAIFAGVAFSCDLISWHFSIKYVGPGVATLLANCQALILAIVGVVFFHERLRFRIVVGIVLAIVGLTLVVAPGWNQINQNFQRGIWFGLLTAICYSGYLLGLRRLQAGTNAPPDTWTMFLVSGVTTVVIGIYGLSSDVSFSIPSQNDLGYVLSYGLICQGIGWLLISNAMPRVHVSLIGLLLFLQPLLAYGWDLILFSKPLVAIELVGAGIAFVGIYLGSIRQ